MRADSQELTKESSANADQSPGDTFAVDFDTPSAIFPSAANENAKRASWISRLPRVSSDQVEASAAIAGLPLESYTQIQSSLRSTLSRFLRYSRDEVSVSLVDVHEMDFSSGLSASNERDGVFVNFNAQLKIASVSFELGARFAAVMVDRMLGGDGNSPDRLHALSKTERAVIEFLCLSFVSELNRQTGEPLLRLQSVSDRPPWLTGRIEQATANSVSGNEVWKRGLVAAILVSAGNLNGIIRGYLNPRALSALDEASRQLRAARQTSTNVARTAEVLARYARVTSDLSLTVLVGETPVTPQELLELEPGDVMMVEKPLLRWRNQRPTGSLSLRIGDAAETLLTSEVSSEIGIGEPAEDSTAEAKPKEMSQGGSIKVRVRATIISPPPQFAERLTMDEEVGNSEVMADPSLIEAVMLTVHVELGARRLRLDELSRLRANQILDLGCNATDPVDLVVDGRRIARGELVDIDGRLGVRIMQIIG